MPLGKRHRETGLLMTSARGLILEVDGGGVYALDADPDVAKYLGQRVTLEGVRNGFDRLDVDWIGMADVASAIIPPSAGSTRQAPRGW